MGEAFLHQNGSGGLRFKSLSASLPAPYNVFYAGQAIDISHAVITANLGKVTMQVPHGSCTFSPQTAAAGLTAITVSFTIGGTTRTATIPITVLSFSSTFANNTWAQIAQAAYYGFAKYLWNPGDTKTLTAGSTSYPIRIIGFDVDSLDETDAMYSDAMYNRGTKKAALTLQWAVPAGKGYMDNSYSEYDWWPNCRMRTITLPNLLASLQSDVKNNVRTVTKRTQNQYLGTIMPGNVITSNSSDIERCFTTADTLFLLSAFDANFTNRKMVLYDPLRTDDYYQLFEYTFQGEGPAASGDTGAESGYVIGDYQSYQEVSGEWSRTGNGASQNCFLAMRRTILLSSNQKYQPVQSDSSLPYFPVFNF